MSKGAKAMAVNKYMRAALKAFSNVEIDIKSNYKLIRQMERVAKKPHIKFTHQELERYINNDNNNILVRIFAPKKVFSPLKDAIPGLHKEKPNIITDPKYPVIIFLHGGGWVTGELDVYDKVCRTIANQTEHMVIAVDYRLAPENPFPAAFEDCYLAVKAIMQWHHETGVPQGITLMGDSAGGNLAAAVSLYMRDKSEEMVNKQILIYPVTYNNHTDASPFPSVMENGTDYLLTSKRICDYMDLYCSNEADRNSPYLAPLLAKDFSNQPDTLIITAEYDPLRDEGEEYGHRLKEAGNHVLTFRTKDVLHGYFSLPIRFSAVKDTYRLINQFLQDNTNPDEDNNRSTSSPQNRSDEKDEGKLNERIN